ncbi:MAG TPA: AI-2E family transporter [Pirellulales bacterium]|nr:AI-2E family transporter [Pirellulales bacterium]
MGRIALNTIVVLSVFVGVYVVWELRAATVLFALSLGLSAALRPSIAWLVRRGMPNLMALSATYLLVFGGVALLLTAAAGPFLTQVQQFGDDFVLAYERLYDRVNDKNTVQGNELASLPKPDDFFASLAGNQGPVLLQTVAGATLTLFGMVVDFIIVVFLGVYWSLDKIHFERLWLSLLPVERRRAAREVWEAVEIELGAYVRSEAIQSLAAGLLLWMGYRVLGQPYPVLLAVAGAVAWLIPWVGVLLAVGAVAFASVPVLLLDPPSVVRTLVPSVLYTSAVLLVLQRFVEPRFFDRRRYNALVTALIIFGMADIAGVMGLVLGAPLAAALQIAGRHWMRWRMMPVNERAGQDSFGERLLELRASLERRKRPAPELVSLVDRLASLVDEADELLQRPVPQQP